MRTLLIVLLVLFGLGSGICSLAVTDALGGGTPSEEFFLFLVATVPLGLALLLFLTRR